MGKGIRLLVVAGVVAAGIGVAGAAQAQEWQQLPPEVIGSHILPRLPEKDLVRLCRTHLRLQGLCVVERQRRAVRIVAGTGQPDKDAGGRAATATALNDPSGMAATPDGDVLLADWGNHRVLRINHTDHTVTVIAGTGQQGAGAGGQAATATALHHPHGVAIAPDGDVLLTDAGNNRVLRINHTDNTITVIAGTGQQGAGAGGQAATATALNNPSGVDITPDGDVLITDTLNDRVLRINHTDNTITVIAGTGQPGNGAGDQAATATALNNPSGVAITPDGDVLIVDTYNHRVLRINHTDNTVTVIAGTGQPGNGAGGRAATATALNYPLGVASTPDGDVLIVDTYNHRVLRINHTDNTVTVIAGTGQPGAGAAGQAATATDLNYPVGVAITPDGDVLLADAGTHRVLAFRLPPAAS